jgi:hypothetical protein
MRIGKVCLIAIICVGIFSQILGAPVSYWELDGSDDDFISSLLMGASVHTEDQHISSFNSFLSLISISAPRYLFLHESFLFHPPIFGTE